MSTLPTRSNIAGVGATYGQVRSALGDLRDFLSESLGTSGTSPVINNGTIQNAISLGVGVETPGTTAQILGSLSVTSAGGTVNPGDGSIYLTGKQLYASSLGSKVEFLAPTGDALNIGRQTDSLYVRTKATGNFNVYAGGTHADAANTPGSGGTELLRLSNSTFTYKGQTIYHSGNGVFIRKDAADTAGEKITFAKGLRSDLKVEIGTEAQTVSNTLEFLAPKAGNKIRLYPGASNENYNIGIQPDSVFLRTAENFTIYKGGVFADLAQTPGTGGVQLFNVNSTGITYKGGDVYHAGNANFVSKTSVNRPGVVNVYNSTADDNKFFVGQHNAKGDGRMWLVSNSGGCRVEYADSADNASGATFRAGSDRPLVFEQSPNRQGVVTMWIANQDTPIYTQMHWNGTRMVFIARHTNNTSYETQVNRADSTGYSDTAGRANGIHGHNIDDGTVRYHELSRGEGSAAGGTLGGIWGVHDFAFSSPLVVNCVAAFWIQIGAGNNANSSVRWWRGQNYNGGLPGSQVIWQYITGSGQPYIWVQASDNGHIIGTWDAEDPVDRSEPETNPLAGIPNTFKIQMPTVEEVLPILETYIRKNPATFKDKFEESLKEYSSSRNMMKEYWKGMDLREFVKDLPGDDQKKEWRVQAILRSITTQLGDNPKRNMHLIFSEVYKVDKKGKLIVK